MANYYRPKFVAKQLSVSVGTIYRWIHEEGLPAEQVINCMLIPAEQFHKWLEAKKTIVRAFRLKRNAERGGAA